MKVTFAVASRQAWELIQTVLPFHAVTFRSGASPQHSRAVLDVLDKCAHRLLYELKMEGLATGLDVHVEVLRLTLPVSVNQMTWTKLHAPPRPAHFRPIHQVLGLMPAWCWQGRVSIDLVCCPFHGVKSLRMSVGDSAVCLSEAMMLGQSC